MSRRAAALPAFLALVLTVTNPQTGGAVQALQTHVLPNGLDVVVLENHTVPLATAVVAVRAGAFTQREGEQGLAHLFEHVLFKVKKNYHKSIDYTLKNISTLVEPLMIFVVAALVGSILMAVMLPFFYIGSTIS